MTLTIILFLLVLSGFAMFGYGMNINREDTPERGEQIRHDIEADNTI